MTFVYTPEFVRLFPHTIPNVEIGGVFECKGRSYRIERVRNNGAMRYLYVEEVK